MLPRVISRSLMTHAVTTLNVTGQLATIGEPGGHRPGAWNANRMNVPRAIAVEDRADGSSRLWVVEEGYSPRRISVWDAASRKLVRDYIGNTRYSASGGFLSDDVPGVGFVDGVKYQVDLAAGTYAPGWETSFDRDPGGKPFLAAYGLGSPFPEDAMICSALGTFWPGPAPEPTKASERRAVPAATAGPGRSTTRRGWPRPSRT